MISIKEFNSKYRYIYILLYYLFLGMLYTIYNKNIVPRYFMHCFIDDYIPFVKEMIIPYILWYAYIVVPLLYFAFTSKEDFLNLCFFMFAGMLICYIIFYIFPNGQNLRPEIHGADIFSKIILLIYTSDRPTNSAPSMHVLNSIAVHCTIFKSSVIRKHKWIVIGSFFLMLSIILSTVMVKQHSILDVMAGVVLSMFMYILVYKLNLVYRLKNIGNPNPGSTISK